MKNGFRVKEYKHDRYKFIVRGKVAGKWERRYFVTKGEATTYAQQHSHAGKLDAILLPDRNEQSRSIRR